MQLFHTSPETEITPSTLGRFDEFLFFSPTIYVMTAGDYHVFVTSLNDSEIIEAGSLWYQDNWEAARPFIDELMGRLSVDEDTAMGLLDGSLSVYDMDIEPEDMADEDWNVQRLTARSAKALGFIGVAVEDEQGAAYMLDVTRIKMEAAK
ncbi:AcrIF11 family anti-CRISPR ADP-ribosyltransferase [Zymobacter palmae]|uniref:NAD-dependent aldehyde dehydrogenases n=1 Tax=Zymobacter palmae TaxID=33074 RepID=A0A348HI59_9GAMM|nr:hypothetical protein [Zymobacter palmae]BBG31311.1 NAD-dependent aldehyde dehydrogenases [Zymobacter palmae]